MASIRSFVVGAKSLVLVPRADQIVEIISDRLNNPEIASNLRLWFSTLYNTGFMIVPQRDHERDLDGSGEKLWAEATEEVMAILDSPDPDADTVDLSRDIIEAIYERLCKTA